VPDEAKDAPAAPADDGFGRPEPARGLNPVDAAITTRRSVRAFKPDPVPEATVREILEIAARAPSGTNIQPWHVWVVAGAEKDRLTKAVLETRESGAEEAEYPYYPEKWREPYLSRRRKIGFDLYGLLGIEKGDKARMWAQFARNYMFFDAPAGFIFTMERDMVLGAWLDFGMFLENIMIAARGRGLDTCPQAAWIGYHKAVRDVLPIPDDHTLVCGMSLGYADNSKPENKLVTVREPVDAFAKFFGF
jgi:nitroreductase